MGIILKTPEEWCFTRVCSECGATCEFYIEDLISGMLYSTSVLDDGAIGEIGVRGIFVRCANLCCRSVITLEGISIPSAIRGRVRREE